MIRGEGPGPVSPAREASTNVRARRWSWIVIFYLGLSVVTGAVSWNTRYTKFDVAVAEQRQAWVALRTPGAAAALPGNPGRGTPSGLYVTRPLLPALIGGVVDTTGLPWGHAFSLVRLASVAVTYIAFHWYLLGWFSPALALLGTLFMAATIPLTFTWFEIPTDFPEILIYTLGIWCIREGRDRLLLLVIAIGTLNRETTAFLVVLLLLCRFESTRPLRVVPLAAAAGLAWAGPFAAIRVWTGLGWFDASVYGDPLAHNLSGLARFLTNFNIYNNYLFYLYLFGAFWILPFVGWRQQPPLLRRALLGIPLLLIVYLFVSASLDEPRQIVNLYPILVPAGLFALFGTEGRGEERGS